jgi:cytochrome c
MTVMQFMSDPKCTLSSPISDSARCRGRRARGRIIQTLLGASALLCALAATGSAAAAGAKVPAGEKVARGSNCFSCHALHHKVVGPAFAAVAKRFAHQPGAKAMLMHAVKFGHVGTWGQIPMPPHPNLSPLELDEVITWVLSIKPQAAAAVEHKMYTYVVDGKKVMLDFPVYQPGTHNVTKTVFRGYELFNSYCFRCHGEDAVGSEYAPDLRTAIKNGMTRAQMTQIAMEGIKAKGMPSWAGFFSPKDLRAIYEYTAGRTYKLVGEGEPPQ